MKNRSLQFNPLIKNSHYQTLIGSAIDFTPELPSTTHYIKLQDQDLMAVEISTPSGWKKEGRSVVMLHGLCGSHKANYMKRIAKKLVKNGMQAIRVNFRGCGSGKGFAKNNYHSGSSDDIFEVLENIKQLFPASPKLLVGVSLGANISLKLAGELGSEGERYIKGVIAISPPINLLSTARLFTLPKNQFYAKYFICRLVKEINFRHQYFNLPPHNLPADLTLNELDELYTAPRAKFSSALEYYYYASSKRVIPKITLPTRILFANDDPIIHASDLETLVVPPNIQMYKTEHGGHIGFMGLNVFKEFRWMDNTIIEWAEEMLNPRS